MVKAVGTAAEAPAVMEALTRVIDKLTEPRHKPDANILNLPEPLPALDRAVHALASRGYQLDPKLSSTGYLFAEYILLEDVTTPRSARWRQSIGTWAIDAQYPLREAALRSIPQPIPQECVPILMKCLTAEDFGVARAACEVAEKSKLPVFARPGLLIIATEDHPWLLRAASTMAYNCGARYELYETWAERLSSRDLFGLALDNLAPALKITSDSGFGRTDLTRGELLALKRAWQQFLTGNAAALKAGKQFPLDDPAVAPALFGRARTFRLADGKEWPPRDLSRQPAPNE